MFLGNRRFERVDPIAGTLRSKSYGCVSVSVARENQFSGRKKLTKRVPESSGPSQIKLDY